MTPIEAREPLLPIEYNTTPLPVLEAEVAELDAKVDAHLWAMGLEWA